MAGCSTSTGPRSRASWTGSRSCASMACRGGRTRGSTDGWAGQPPASAMRGGEADADAYVADGEPLLDAPGEGRPLDEVRAEEAGREPVHREHQQRQRHEDAAQPEHLRKARGVRADELR